MSGWIGTAKPDLGLLVRKLFQKSSSKEGLKGYLLDVSDLEEDGI